MPIAEGLDHHVLIDGSEIGRGIVVDLVAPNVRNVEVGIATLKIWMAADVVANVVIVANVVTRTKKGRDPDHVIVQNVSVRSVIRNVIVATARNVSQNSVRATSKSKRNRLMVSAFDFVLIFHVNL